MKILGISAFYHDSAAALIKNGEIIAAAQEERFTRVKNTNEFPLNAIKFCLKESGFEISDLDAIVFYENPNLKFERFILSHIYFAPKGFKQFVVASYHWISNKIMIKKKILKFISLIGTIEKKTKIIFSQHHLSHSASSFFTSNFKESAIINIDGVGEWATASILKGNDNNITLLKEMRYPHSIGLLYSSFTFFLGFKVNSGEYKLMGLAPYGNLESQECKNFIKIIKRNLVTINSDGSIFLSLNYFNFHKGLSMIQVKKWESLFGFPLVTQADKIKMHHCNLALAIQTITEEIIIKLAIEAKRITNSEYLCFAGGVALNCVANGKLLKKNIFKDIHIQPAAGDAGGSVGAALSAFYIYFNNHRYIKNEDLMNFGYLGPSFSDQEIFKTLNNFKAKYFRYELFSDLTKKITSEINKGKVIGWFQGRMEFGPRALGNRSIIADARNPEMQKNLNVKIKNRESFRPFAPSVLSELQTEYFDLDKASHYMLFTAPVNRKNTNLPPIDYYGMELMDRLNFKRSIIPAVTHVNYSARIQTVSAKSNYKFNLLLKHMYEDYGIGLLINTSFNVRGEPIVCSPEDAFRCFMGTDMDILVLENFVLFKDEQVDFQNNKKWKINWNLD